MSATSRRVRWLHGGLVSLLGLLALALPAADLSQRVPDPWGPETLAGDVAVASLAAPLILGGVWLATRDWEPRDLAAVVVRTYVATVAAAVLAGWATVLWIRGDPTQYVVAVDGVLIAALLTFAISVLNVENVRRTRASRRNETAYRELVEEVLDCSTEPTVVVGADGTIAWLNDAATTAFGVDCESAVGRGRDAMVADVFEPVDSPTPGGAEYRVPSDGRGARRFERRRHEIDDGRYAGGRIEQYTEVTAERDAVDALASVASLAGASGTGTMGEVLDAGRELLDAEYAAFTRIDGDRTVETVRSERVDPIDGDTVPTLHDRSIREVRQAGAVRTGRRSSDGEVGEFEFDHGAGTTFDTFVAAPAESGGELVGVVTFLSAADEPFSARERALVELLAGWAGVAHVAGDRYDRALEHERERLEFVNRIVRHNILNGLNLVNARVDHLEQGVDDPEATEHLSVVESQVDDMADLIDTIRAFMHAALSRRDDVLEPVPIRAALEEKLSLAAETYDASLRVHGLPDDDCRVAADELTGEVFENVLSNAVEHNDREEPTVEVWTSRSTEPLPVTHGQVSPSAASAGGARALGDGGQRPTEGPALTVHVADDGPGIPDERKRRLLQHGDAALDDPGHGFGFYLVREMMESYGGGVRIRDNEPRGTVVELVFPIERS